jgi:hypothetical protein
MRRSVSTEESVSANRAAIDPLFDDLTVYHDVGLDTAGRAHFFDSESREIVVTDTDRRGQGVRNADVVETISVGRKTVDQYCQYVRDDADCSWVECDWNPEVA